MGFFDFVGTIGKKLFSKPEDAAQKIKQEIESANPGLANVTVEYTDGVVKLGGTTADPAVVEKAVLMAGNIEGVTKVNIDNLKGPKLSDQIECYVIEKGDNLSKIAKRFLGDANRYPEIFEANREVIRNPDKIFPGQKIRIPLA